MEVVKAAASLSGGTLATLTGLRKYADLDKARADFTAFCAANVGKFENWAQAWEAFKTAGKQ